MSKPPPLMVQLYICIGRYKRNSVKERKRDFERIIRHIIYYLLITENVKTMLMVNFRLNHMVGNKAIHKKATKNSNKPKIYAVTCISPLKCFIFPNLIRRAKENHNNSMLRGNLSYLKTQKKVY